MMHYEQMEELIEVGEHWCKSILSAPQRKRTLFHGARVMVSAVQSLISATVES